MTGYGSVPPLTACISYNNNRKKLIMHKEYKLLSVTVLMIVLLTDRGFIISHIPISNYEKPCTKLHYNHITVTYTCIPGHLLYRKH